MTSSEGSDELSNNDSLLSKARKRRRRDKRGKRKRRRISTEEEEEEDKEELESKREKKSISSEKYRKSKVLLDQGLFWDFSNNLNNGGSKNSSGWKGNLTIFNDFL
jgi:hypothetical protein